MIGTIGKGKAVHIVDEIGGVVRPRCSLTKTAVRCGEAGKVTCRKCIRLEATPPPSGRLDDNGRCKRCGHIVTGHELAIGATVCPKCMPKAFARFLARVAEDDAKRASSGAATAPTSEEASPPEESEEEPAGDNVEVESSNIIDFPVKPPKRSRRAILFLDLATTTGWAFIRRDGTGASGARKFKRKSGETEGVIFAAFRQWLRGMIDVAGMTRGDWLAWERTFSRGSAARKILEGLEAGAKEVASELGLETMPVGSSTIKKRATGNGRASKEKVVAAAIRAFGEPVDSYDEADALWGLQVVRENVA